MAKDSNRFTEGFDDLLDKASDTLKTHNDRRTEIAKEYLDRKIDANADGRVAELEGKKSHLVRAAKDRAEKADFVKEILDRAAYPLPKNPGILTREEHELGGFRGEPAPNAVAAFSAMDKRQLDPTRNITLTKSRKTAENIKAILDEAYKQPEGEAPQGRGR